MGKETDIRILEHVSLGKILHHGALALTIYVLSFGLFVMALVPSYEVFNKIVVIESQWSITLVIPGLTVALLLQKSGMDHCSSQHSIHCAIWISEEQNAIE